MVSTGPRYIAPVRSRGRPTVAPARSLGLALCALGAAAALAGCGAGARPATTTTHATTGAGTHASVERGERAPAGTPGLTDEEMREYDANEGRCRDDGGGVRDVGTVDAYCAFPARSNDFHLIETSHGKEPVGETE